MVSRAETVQDHRERLNRVLDYIRRHLDQPLTLGRLAEVACFSPFHFHRIFAAYVGETVGEHVMRLRLELAAHRLTHTDRAVTAIALTAGYETPSAFTRAFGRHFGVSPSVFQKERRSFPRSESPFLPVTTNTQESVMKPDIRTREATTVIYARRIGDYNQSAQAAWSAVCGYAGPRGLIGPQAEFIGCSHDDPSITPAEKLRYDACVTVRGPVKPEGDIGVQQLEAGRYAVFLHEGPYHRLAATYAAIYRQWLPQSGVALRDAICFEKYLNSPDQAKPDDLRTEIWIPIEAD
ncbi:MAG: AraC family transcriptional regulator [Candidatus Krumholzibacteria bacterium]|jgi:AraC family transcriptional regulator|nr:AraC family transcriptional regulator [Candidatus Krumholzibacteria bacterium]